MRTTRYIKRDYPDRFIATVRDGVCVGCIWWQGPGDPIRVQWMSGDPWAGKTVEDLVAAGFTTEAQHTDHGEGQ